MADRPSVVCYADGRMAHQVEYVTAFARGLWHHGLDFRVREPGQAVECDIAVTWGLRHAHVASLAQRHIIVEMPYFAPPGTERDDKPMVSAAWDALNGRGEFCNAQSPPDRWEQYGREMAPWRWAFPDSCAIILGQVPGDFSHAGLVDLDKFYRQVIDELAAYRPNLSPRWRPHPKAPMHNAPCPHMLGTLFDVLDASWCGITFNSNAAVDAVLAGFPMVVYDRGSMAWPMAAHDVREPLAFPDREQWAYNLAYCQWTKSELERGETWAHLSRGWSD